MNSPHQFLRRLARNLARLAVAHSIGNDQQDSQPLTKCRIARRPHTMAVLIAGALAADVGASIDHRFERHDRTDAFGSASLGSRRGPLGAARLGAWLHAATAPGSSASALAASSAASSSVGASNSPEACSVT